MPVAPPMTVLLEGNGSLQGNDQSGLFSAVGAGAVRYRPAPGARVNLIRNARAAIDASGWGNHSFATVARVADGAFSGGTALECVCSGAGAGSGLTRTAPAETRTYDSPVVTVSFDAYLVSGSANWGYRKLSRNATGSLLGVDLVQLFTLTPAVQRFTITFSPEVGAHAITPRVTCMDALPSTARFSNFMVESGAIATPSYVEGVWLDPLTGFLGSAHASPSVSRAVYWNEEGTTNIFLNPSMENVTAMYGWNPVGVAGNAIDTSRAYLGTKSLCRTRVGGGNEGLQSPATSTPVTAGVTYTSSIYVATSVNISNLRLFVNYYDASIVLLQNTQTNPLGLSVVDGWRRFEYTTIAPVGAAYAVVGYYTSSGAVGDKQWYDCAQFEPKPYATSICIGDIGTGYAFAGTAHASASTRTGSSESFDQAGRIFAPRGAAEILEFIRDRDSGSIEPILDCGDGTAGRDRLRLRINANDQFEIVWKSNGGADRIVTCPTPILPGNVYKLYADWDGVYARVAVNDGPLTEGLRDIPQNDWGTADLVLKAA